MLAEPVPGSKPRSDIARGARYTVGAVVVVVAALLCWYLRDLLLSVLIALLLAAGLEPLVALLRRTGLPRGIAVFGVLLTLLLAGVALVALTFVPAVQQFTALVQDLPNEVHQLSQQDNAMGEFLRRTDLPKLSEIVTAHLSAVVSTGFGALFVVLDGVIVTLTIVVLTAYFMMALPRMRHSASVALNNEGRQGVLGEALSRIGGYLTGQVLVSLLAGSCAFVMLYLIGAPYPLALGLVVAFLDLIPQIGAALGSAFVVLVTMADSLSKAIIMLVFFAVYQMAENWVLAPRIFAKKINLSPVAAFVATLIGVSLAGAIGAVFALPVAASVKVVLEYVFRAKLHLIRASPPP